MAENASQRVEFEQPEPTFVEFIMFLVREVKWTQPWIIALYATMLVLVGLAIKYRKHSTMTSILFLSIMFIIFQAQNINKLARKYWNRFADKNYFDSEGGFITIFVSFPLMVIELYILINLFFQLIDALAKSKMMKDREKRKKFEEKLTNEEKKVESKDKPKTD